MGYEPQWTENLRYALMACTALATRMLWRGLHAMTYHLTPVQRFRKLEPSYEGLHLGTHRIRLTQRFAARLTGVLRAQVSL
jgi:hypothetical protein